MVNHQLHSNYRNSWCSFMAEKVSLILGCINNNIIRERVATFNPALGTFAPAGRIKHPVLASPIQARHWYAGEGPEEHKNDKGLKHLEVKASSSLSTHSLQFTKEKENWKATNSCSVYVEKNADNRGLLVLVHKSLTRLNDFKLRLEKSGLELWCTFLQQDRESKEFF